MAETFWGSLRESFGILDMMNHGEEKEGCEQFYVVLLRGAALSRLGPYQLEAAIQSAHCQRALGQAVAPAALLALYDGLIALKPSIGALVSRACALAAVLGPDAALRELNQLPATATRNYQAYWAARAHLALAAGRREEAASAFERAMALTDNPAVKAYLKQRQAMAHTNSGAS